jgi:SWI/SNF-related matrix-associated actin-dependent regulator 1 of chromatin subfamily A
MKADFSMVSFLKEDALLRYNESNNSFILYTEDDEKAQKAGLTLSRKAKGPNGENVYFTSDYKQKPEFNPYAVLDFYDDGDDKVKKILSSLRAEYTDSWKDDSEFGYPCPEGLEYLPYQRAGIQYALEKGNCIIGDEPGLGKTIQAIGVANAIGARRVLVLCPASIRLNWQHEINLWSTIPLVSTQAILKGSTEIAVSVNYIICSYDLARKENVHKKFMARDWDLIIADEAHYLKSPEALRTRSMFGGGDKQDYFYNNGLINKTDKIIALTGTPLPNRPREAYTLTRGLDWEAIDYASYDKFTYRYNPSAKFGSHSEERKGRLSELNARLRCNLMVRRHKKDVLTQLPDKRYEMTYVEPNGAISEV